MVGAGGGVVAVGTGARRSSKLTAAAAQASPDGTGQRQALLIPTPGHECEVETKVKNSRFVASLAHTPSVEAAREYIASVKSRKPDGRHHCYAFAIGHGASVTHGISDDGEPAGTAGRPMLAVLTGSNLGDCTVVITRYFGGTKLGTGGLVKAYTEAAQLCLLSAQVASKRSLVSLSISGIAYHQYPRIKTQLENAVSGIIEDEHYAADVAVRVAVGEEAVETVKLIVSECTAGQATLRLL